MRQQRQRRIKALEASEIEQEVNGLRQDAGRPSHDESKVDVSAFAASVVSRPACGEPMTLSLSVSSNQPFPEHCISLWYCLVTTSLVSILPCESKEIANCIELKKTRCIGFRRDARNLRSGLSTSVGE